MQAQQIHERSSLPRDPTTLRSLVLNADFRPLSTWPLSLISAQDAVSAIWRDRASVVEEWDGAFFRSPSISIAVPKVVALREYAPISGEPKFCRRSVLLRDRFCCQFCGKRFESHELTFDHVRPRAHGGMTTWENVVAACIPCNAQKGCSFPNFSGRKAKPAKDGRLRPLKEPRRPTTAELLRAGLEFLPSDIRQDFGSFLYWDAELLP